VNEAGPIAVEMTSDVPATVWIDAEPFERETRIEREFSAGKHTLTLRIPLADQADPQLKVELIKPTGSSAQFVVVGGI
jgi:hypothetical protein